MKTAEGPAAAAQVYGAGHTGTAGGASPCCLQRLHLSSNSALLAMLRRRSMPCSRAPQGLERSGDCCAHTSHGTQHRGPRWATDLQHCGTAAAPRVSGLGFGRCHRQQHLRLRQRRALSLHPQLRLLQQAAGQTGCRSCTPRRPAAAPPLATWGAWRPSSTPPGPTASWPRSSGSSSAHPTGADPGMQLYAQQQVRPKLAD